MQYEIENSIPAPVQEFYELYQQNFSSVSFPDVSLEILDKLISDVHEKMKALEEARALLDTAQQNLENSQNELLQKSMRALAYAKIYAEDQEELFKQLSSLNLAKSSRSSRKSSSEPGEVKRTRSKKQEKTEAAEEAQVAEV
ncbi:MAG: hypothetical protein GX267_15570 [Fibrobacter sp.]|jgi:uncharacterized protein YigA (DUF484 family)|nr:hypothetical protein [Fibrobacter sp.]